MERGSMNTILLQDLLNVKQMQRIQDTLTEFLGVGVIAVDVNGIPITESSTFSYFCNHLIHKTPDGLEQCKACDAILSTPESKEHISFYHCHAGLTAFSIPLYINNQIIAYFVGGQVLTK